MASSPRSISCQRSEGAADGREENGKGSCNWNCRSDGNSKQTHEIMNEVMVLDRRKDSDEGETILNWIQHTICLLLDHCFPFFGWDEWNIVDNNYRYLVPEINIRDLPVYFYIYYTRTYSTQITLLYKNATRSTTRYQVPSTHDYMANMIPVPSSPKPVPVQV